MHSAGSADHTLSESVGFAERDGERARSVWRRLLPQLARVHRPSPDHLLEPGQLCCNCVIFLVSLSVTLNGKIPALDVLSRNYFCCLYNNLRESLSTEAVNSCSFRV